LVGKPEGKRPFGRHRYRPEDNIKMHETDLEDVDCILLNHNRDRWLAVVNTVMNNPFPLKVENVLISPV
jgi:hypothetical protein